METPVHNSILTRLERLEDRDVLDMREPVEKLRDSQGWLIVRDELKTQIDGLRRLIEWGKPQEQAEYAYQAGVLRGLQSAEAVVEAIIIAGNRAQQSLLKAAQLAEGVTS